MLDPATAIVAARDAYTHADNVRSSGDKHASIALYLDAAHQFDALTAVTAKSPFSAHDGALTRIDQVARYYLMKVGHDLGGLYLYNGSNVHGLSGCDRYATSYLYSLESEKQADLGGFGGISQSNGTAGNLSEAKTKLTGLGCDIPAYRPMFHDGSTPASGPTATHTYAQAGRYTARVTVSDGVLSSSATVQVTAGSGLPPVTTPPGGGGGGNANQPLEGFGAQTKGGAGGRVIHVTQPTDAAVRAAFADALNGPAIVHFDVAGPITINSSLNVEANNLTIEGNGVTLVGSASLGGSVAGMLAIHGHDVIVRDMRLRNGGDNIRAQYDTAYNIVFDHLSSTGSHDDGISIGYGAHNVTVQYCFLAGNTRSIFIKYGATNNISIHHTWVMKQWIRGPLASQSAFVDFRNNIVEDWVLWGVRYEKSASGNVVNSIFGEGTYAKNTFNNANDGMNVTSDMPVYISGDEFRGTATSKALASAPSELPAASVNTQSVAAMEPNVRANAGAMPRDAVDQQYIDTASGWSVGKERPLRFF